MRTTPLRRITLHFSQRFFTDGLTFMQETSDQTQTALLQNSLFSYAGLSA